jgi:hypothetical protein
MYSKEHTFYYAVSFVGCTVFGAFNIALIVKIMHYQALKDGAQTALFKDPVHTAL